MTSARVAPIDRARRDGGRTSDRVLTELTAAIRELRLPPGQSVSETDLAEAMQVSRTPVREAIDRLAGVGLIDVVPQVGTRISPIRLSDVEEARFVRESLEVAAFELACGRPARDVTEHRRLLAQQRRACEDGELDAFFGLDESFHERTFVLAGHPGAWRVVQRSKLQLDRLRRLSLPEPSTLAQLIDDHTAILDALHRGALRDGSRCIRIHARRVLEHAPRLRARHPEYFVD